MNTETSVPIQDNSLLSDVYVARQPILDRGKNLYGYELLFRDSLKNMVPDVDGDMATSKLLLNSHINIGLDILSGGKKVFINFTRKSLVQELPSLFPRDTTIVEILEDIKPDPEIIKACKNLSQRGYVLALDDFVFQSGMEPLIELADIIKVDLRLISIDRVKDHLSLLKNWSPSLLAEKVETHEEFRKAVEMGFKFFQGYFFHRPEIIQGKEITTSHISLLKTIIVINQPDYDMNRVEKLIRQDLGISYKLLRYINTAYFRRGKQVDNIKQALMLLGENEFRRFVSLMVLSSAAPGKSSELMRNSFIRARFCELLGQESACPEKAESQFTVGLFSSLDAIFDQSMEAIVEKLPLSSDISEALISREGVLGKYLQLIEFYEAGEWKSVNKLAAELCILEEKLPPIYLKACQFASLLPA